VFVETRRQIQLTDIFEKSATTNVTK